LNDSSTVAFRAGATLKKVLEEITKDQKLSNVSELLRKVAADFVASYYENRTDANACKQHEVDLSKGEICPLLLLARSEACKHCGYREQPIVDRETPDPASSSSDEASKMIDDLFREDTKKP
jgi:hypothetical protein